MINTLIPSLRRYWLDSIRGQLALSFALATAILMLAFSYGMVQHERSFLMEQSAEYAGDLAHTLSVSSASWVVANDVAGLQEVLAGLVHSPNLEYALVLSPEGRVLASTNAASVGQFVKDAVSLKLLSASSEQARIVLVDSPALADVAAPVLVGRHLVGWVRVGWGRGDVTASLNETVRRGYIMTAVAIVLTVMLALMISRRLTTALRQLMQVARLVYGGRRDVRAKVSNRDEVGLLALHFNRMLDALASSERDQTRLNLVLHDAEERLRFALEGAGDSVWEWDIDKSVVILTRRWKQEFGYPDDDEQVSFEYWSSRIHPEDRAVVLARLEAHLSGATSAYVCEYRTRCRQQEWKWVLGRGMVSSHGEDGRPLRMTGTHADISERKLAEESMQMATLVYQTTGEALMVTDSSEHIIAVNPAFTKVTGFAPAEVIGKHAELLHCGRHDLAFHEEIRKQIETTGQWQGEMWSRRKNGEAFIEWLSINAIFNDDGSVYRRVALFSDLTEKKQSDALIWQQANFDSLTGLPNRSMFYDRLAQEIKNAQRSNLPLAVLLMDLDRFKEINDTLGHDMGDLLLKQAALRLTSCLRETDTVAHLGGDEFSIILSEVDDMEGVERMVQTLLRTLAQPFRLGDELAYTSASVGITLYPDDATVIDTLLKNADQAMYAAKHDGRNRYHYFTPSMQETAQIRMRLANDLRVALAGNQFRVVYQPIVSLQSGVIHKAEALIRWQHPTRGLISPAQFIPIAEETGMIVEIGDWIFREAAQQAMRWRSSHHPQFQISVNKSPVQFRHHQHHDRETWVSYLQRMGMPGQSIAVEITEGLLMDANASITEQLLAFRDAGIQVALDDFGTGYSSLSYLKKFDIDYIKIDQSFVRNLAPGSNDMALCEAIIVMAHKLGMKVIAEGVETTGQRDLLAQAGCDFGQGYVFSRPVPALEFEEMLKNFAFV